MTWLRVSEYPHYRSNGWLFCSDDGFGWSNAKTSKSFSCSER